MLLRITPGPYGDGVGDPRRDFGAFLGALRRIRGLSRYDLANAMGVKYPYLANIENGQRPLTPAHWGAVAAALGIPADKVETLATCTEADRVRGVAPSLPGLMDSVIADLSPTLEGWQILELQAVKERAAATPRQSDWVAAINVATRPQDVPPGDFPGEEPLSLGSLPRLRPPGVSSKLATVLEQLTAANRERLTAYAEGLLASQEPGSQDPRGVGE